MKQMMKSVLVLMLTLCLVSSVPFLPEYEEDSPEASAQEYKMAAGPAASPEALDVLQSSLSSPPLHHSQQSRQHLWFQTLEALLARHFRMSSRDRTLRNRFPRKRGGLGNCINGCMHSGGGLNFIQCKTMCY